MDEQNPSATETADQTATERTAVGWGFWALYVPALAAAGALSYRVGAEAPLARHTLAPAAMVIFGLLAGGVHALALRRQAHPTRWWFLASSLAGLLAASLSFPPTSLAATSARLLAGWAYGWAVYGAVFGVMLQRIFPDRRLMLASLAGWGTAGIVSGAVGWFLDVFMEAATDPALSSLPSTSRTWSMGGLAVVGAVCGATGAAITGAALVLRSRVAVPPQTPEVRQATDTGLVNTAGAVSGLIAAVLCTCLAPPISTALLGGSPDSLDLAVFFLGTLAGSLLCIPTYAVVSIPLAIGCGYVGLEMARASGGPRFKPWVWCGAAVGGVAGCILGSLVAFAIGHP